MVPKLNKRICKKHEFSDIYKNTLTYLHLTFYGMLYIPAI